MFCECGCGQVTKISPVNRACKKWVRGMHRRFVHGHNIKSHLRALATKRRIYSARSSERGDDFIYNVGHKIVRELRGRPKWCEICCSTDPTTRYEWANLTRKYEDPVDYMRLCKSCHQRLDTGGQAVKRTHCPQGHEYSPENTYKWGSYRYCRRCMRAHARASRARLRGEIR